jgi:hypothetical protein
MSKARSLIVDWGNPLHIQTATLVMAFSSGDTIMPGLHYSMDTAAAAFAATAMRVKRLRRQRAVRNWQSALAKLEHKEKHKEKFKHVLGDIHQCGFEAGVTMRQQLSDFLAWYDDWAYCCPRNQEEQDIESNLYGTMVGYDNVYLRDWNEALARPSAKWKPPVLHQFCSKCALYHGRVSWCN